MKAHNPWGDATIKTLLHRLMQKGAVRSEKEDGRQRYHAVLERDVWLDEEIAAVVDRLFGGDFDAMADHVRGRQRR